MQTQKQLISTLVVLNTRQSDLRSSDQNYSCSVATQSQATDRCKVHTATLKNYEFPESSKGSDVAVDTWHLRRLSSTRHTAAGRLFKYFCTMDGMCPYHHSLFTAHLR